LLALIVLALAADGCGDGDPGSQRGGTLKVLAAGDVDNIDPGVSYYQFGYMVHYATQRPLYSWKPGETAKAAPDLAESDPEISDGGKTVKIRIREGVRFSPPVSREVTSRDVKYAIERGATPNVANPYVGTYFDTLRGFAAFQDGRSSGIAGIQTPDDRTIILRTTKPTGVIAVPQALSLPLTAPVPEEYARRFDRKKVSTYGQHQVATGPYMIQSDRAGKVTGYKPGTRILLVRNPNWNRDTDYREGNLDRIQIEEGNDPAVASRQILSGRSSVSGDLLTPPAVIKQASQTRGTQLAFTPSGANRYVVMNTTIPPFDDVNVRRAVLAAADRQALRLTIGGAAVGDIATHFIPPGIPGFDEAGGYDSKFDFLRKPGGDKALAARYFRKAGFERGRYEGDKRLLMVGVTGEPGAKTSEVARDLFQKLGFKVNFRLASPETMLTKFCGTPKAKVAICPAIGWGKDFNDGQAVLLPTFSGRSIAATNNVNSPQLDDPNVNAAMEKATALTDPDARAKAWAKIDLMVTALAPAIPWVWDKQTNLRSANVAGVVNRFNGTWDLSFTALK
jgi:peptide/nickel transport system substrate-binding protein